MPFDGFGAARVFAGDTGHALLGDRPGHELAEFGRRPAVGRELGHRRDSESAAREVLASGRSPGRRRRVVASTG